MPAAGWNDEAAYDAERAVSRRRVLQLLAAAPPLLATSGWLPPPAGAQAVQAAPTIVKPLPPEWFNVLGTNAEMRWDAFRGQGFTVPNERFFVRNHTSTPAIDAESWRLQVFGSGLRRPEGISLSYRDLRRMRSRTVIEAVECAGNGRRFFRDQQGTPAAGTSWSLGAIGVARWKGVPLADILDRAGLRPTAVDVMPEGLDATVVSGGVDQGHVRRPLPVGKALDDVLVAYEMNGEPLPPDHGFPARLVVPGWVGIASIKWLGRIEVADQPLFSPWNTTSYRMTGPTYPPDSPPLTTQLVKSAFELPWDATLPAGERTVLHGRSWSGVAPIRRVDVSLDDGATWRPAHLHHSDRGRSWTRWSVPWTPRSGDAGPRRLIARATDRTGATQPATVPFNDAGYQFWATVRHPITVGGTRADR
ncbi:sulfite oxidase [Nocardioides speluncae]|uniref:sulfite oxidase n=1 Tax=Nocardioides speluncae TaxID=2670337 RepID=UPI000D68FA10|nr:sulfite oxidase [Nocardioides speluncae]